MRERARKTATGGRARRASRASRPAGPAERARADGEESAGAGSRSDEPARGVVASLVDELFNRAPLLDPSQPVGRLSALLLSQFLEGPAMVLRSYQRALDECSPNASPEDQVRQVARAMMGAYLEMAMKLPEHRERLLATHSVFVKTCLDTIESLQRRLAGPPG